MAEDKRYLPQYQADLWTHQCTPYSPNTLVSRIARRSISVREGGRTNVYLQLGVAGPTRGDERMRRHRLQTVKGGGSGLVYYIGPRTNMGGAGYRI